MGKEGTTRTIIDANYDKGTIGNKTDAVQGLTDLKLARFGVFGYFTGAKDYREADYTWASGSTWKATETNKYPNFFYNQQLMFDDITGKNAWVYDPVKYWPNGIDKANDDTQPNVDNTPSNTALQKQEGMLSFFAFAPYMAISNPLATTIVGTDATKIPDGVTAADVATPKTITIGTPVNNGVVGMSTNASNSDVWVKYVMPSASTTDAVDLLWGLAGKDAYKEADAVSPAKVIGSDYNENLTKQIVPERVKFIFKHALAKMGGARANGDETTGDDPLQCGLKVVADVDKNSSTPKVDGQSDQGAKYFPEDFNNKKTLITLKSVRIQDGKSAYDDTNTALTTLTVSDLLTFGWFDIETGKWCEKQNTFGCDPAGATYSVVATSTNTDLNDTEYLINKDIREPADAATVAGLLKDTSKDEWTGDGTEGKPSGVNTGTPKPVFANENVPGLLFIPTGESDGSTKQHIYVTVDYVVRTADPNLNKGYSEVEQIITNEVILDGKNLDPNKYYTIIMHLGMTSVKFEAVVTDWAKKDGSSFEEDGDVVEAGDDNVEEVWLPSNVVTNNIVVSLANNNYFPNLKNKSTVVTVKANGSDTEITDYTANFTFEDLPAWLTYDAASHTLTTLNDDGGDNYAGTDRTATITAVYKYTTTGTPGTETTLKQKINVTQYGAVALNVTAAPGTGKDGNFKVGGETRALTVKLKGTDITSTVAAGDVTIVTADAGLSYASGILTATTNATGDAERSWTVTVTKADDATYGKCTGTVTVKQDANHLTASYSPAQIGAAVGSKVTLTVSLNGTELTAAQYNDVDVTFIETWLKYNKDTHTIEVTEANPGTSTRTATATVNYGTLTVDGGVTVTQAAP